MFVARWLGVIVLVLMTAPSVLGTVAAIPGDGVEAAPICIDPRAMPPIDNRPRCDAGTIEIDPDIVLRPVEQAIDDLIGRCPYIDGVDVCLAEDPALLRKVLDALERASECIVVDPYANPPVQTVPCPRDDA